MEKAILGNCERAGVGIEAELGAAYCDSVPRDVPDQAAGASGLGLAPGGDDGAGMSLAMRMRL